MMASQSAMTPAIPPWPARHQLQVGMPLLQVRKLFLVARPDQDLHLLGENPALALGHDQEQTPNHCPNCETRVHNLLLGGIGLKNWRQAGTLNP